MLIAQWCLNGLNIHPEGLLLFLSGWTMDTQHRPHMGISTLKIQQGVKGKQAAVSSEMLN